MRNLVIVSFCLALAWARLAAGGEYASALIENVPHVKQKPDFCGEACAEMWLRKLGCQADQDYVFDRSGLDPLLARGCWTKELYAALQSLGFKLNGSGAVIDATQAGTELERQWAALHADLANGVPSIVCMRTSEDAAKATEHFRLILGYAAATEEVIYHEPAEDNGAYRRMKRATLLSLWPLKYDDKKWTVIRLRLETGKLDAGEKAKGFDDAAYCQRMMEIKRLLPEKGFHVVLEKPFIVIGDGDAKAVKRHAERTVRWAADKLSQAYFSKDPDCIYAVWLFKDKESYLKYNKEIFGEDDPGTPFGYCSSRHRALIMNIDTGGGTLVHEMVHAYVAGNFPACPSWFNEGLASLYEQCGEEDGEIVGRVNWRLPGLQKALAKGGVVDFKTLCSTTRYQFYNMDKGTNYGQARYLCLYLQEQGLLHRYYREFVKNREKDPSGYDTLVTVMGEKDMDEFRKKWEKWVLGLVYE